MTALLTKDVLSLDTVPSDTADPAAQNALTQMENRVAVGQLLETLPTDEYHVVRLLFGDDQMTVRTAADELGIDKETVMARRDRALARMRSNLVPN